jgi:hypothetical protein
LKQTRKIAISDLVFTSEDVRRIATIFDRQEKPQPERTRSNYVVQFDNNTQLESDTPEVFSDESLTAPARPVSIQMSFHDFTRERHISLSIDHGDSRYGFGNQAVVSGSEPAWLSENFLALEDTLKRTRPQSIWFRRHPTILLNLIALGIGSLGLLLITSIVHALDYLGLLSIFGPPSPNSFVQAILALPKPLLNALAWFWRWALGFTWGASEVRRSLLTMWPSIEFDFGFPHLQMEKKRRTYLRAVAALIILPIITSLLYDLLKHAW